MLQTFHLQRATILFAALCPMLATGCVTADRLDFDSPIHTNIPRELQKTTMPRYVIEPPDELLIQTVNNIRPRNDKLRPGDSLQVIATPVLPVFEDDDEITRGFKQIASSYLVGNDGSIDLGPQYFKVEVAGLTVDEAKEAILAKLGTKLKVEPWISVELEQLAGTQVVNGLHLVRPDGTVHLGVYGDVLVAGFTLNQAKVLLEEHLSQYILDPEVNIDVNTYASKVYYVITDGGGQGEQVYPFTITGNETVLDAMANINGLPFQADKKRMWIARPAPSELDVEQLLPIDWNAIARGASTRTNYQIMPNDRIYVKADVMITMDSVIAKITAPFERLLGFTLLGNSTVRTIQRGQQLGGGGQF